MEAPKSNEIMLQEVESVLSSRLYLSGLYHIRYYSILIKLKLPKEQEKEMCCDLWHHLALHRLDAQSKPMEYEVGQF